MTDRLPTKFVELLFDAVLKSFNRKAILRQFLARHKVSEQTLARWHEGERKREWLARLFPEMEKSERGRVMLQNMARDIAERAKFPDLEGFEDSQEMIASAAQAVRDLRAYLVSEDEARAESKANEATRKVARERREAAIQARDSLQKLEQRFNDLFPRMGTPEAGTDFERWFYELATHEELLCRPGYWVDGRNIDGSVTVEGTTYLVECKFTRDKTDAPDIDSILAKIRKKADNTMGIMVSPSGYTSAAIKAATGDHTPLILIQAEHIIHVLRGLMTLGEMIARLRRHASQTGDVLLLPRDFSGK